MSTARINLFWLIIFGLTLPVSVVLSTHLARRTFEKVRLRGQTITVKGYAEKAITSDRAEWSARIVERDADRTAGYLRLEEHRTRLLAYLQANGFNPEQVDLMPVEIAALYARDEKGHATNTVEAYTVSQRFSVASTDVHRVARAARDASTLIREGIELNAEAPSFQYTKLDDVKLEMLGEATANARQRAQRLVGGSTDRLGPLRSASQGVFQITPAFSTEVSGYGVNDTSSLEKSIKAVVTAEYAIEE